jgi:hypothetical protein
MLAAEVRVAMELVFVEVQGARRRRRAPSSEDDPKLD